MIESEVKAIVFAIAKTNKHPDPESYTNDVYLNYQEPQIEKSSGKKQDDSVKVATDQPS